MTALSGGDRHDNEPSPMSSVLERPNATGGEERPGPRPLDQIFPLRGDASRGRQMQETWLAFCADMAVAVRTALDGSRSPPEIAYAIGEIVHNYFRTRGVTLTSFELRRLVAEILELQHRGRGRPSEPDAPSLVTFTAGPAAAVTPWTGDEAEAAAPVVPDSVFEGPLSKLVTLPMRDAFAVDALLPSVVAGAEARLAAAAGGRRVGRDEALTAIDATLDEIFQGRAEPPPAEARERLSLLALSEICGLGLIDRLWADPLVRAVFVNGPRAVYVERDGGLEPAPEMFRDQAHLLEFVGRLVRRPPSGVAEFQLRDGSEGTVVFPPAAPAGPVVVLRRGEPGKATFDRLIAAEMLDRPIADLLRIAARCRLNVLIEGPAGSGKTAVLAAIARDLGGAARLVTVARHREFSWLSPAKVELVAPSGVEAGVPYPVLLTAGTRLRPDLLIVELGAARGRCGTQGAVVAGRPRYCRSRWSGCDGHRARRIDRPRRSAPPGARWIVPRGCDRRRQGRRPVRSRERSVSSTDGRAVLCRRRAGSGLRRGAFERSALATATGRHIPTGVENPLPATPISGTNRFEMRGILRVGTLMESAPLKGRMHGRQACVGHSWNSVGDRGHWLRGQRPGTESHRRAARLAGRFPAVLHAGDGRRSSG